ncbi:hypothetical protein XarzCFBP7410_10630 [Xanthomonas arboricola pv. zantedeschiae]|nr:hypothetical protein XarzCFBP7410_10630 [Xanthomonas arboricola pv. zantedeschiae]
MGPRSCGVKLRTNGTTVLISICSFAMGMLAGGDCTLQPALKQAINAASAQRIRSFAVGTISLLWLTLNLTLKADPRSGS